MKSLLFKIYNSLVIALLLSFISFKIVWLEMRVNIGLLIPVYAVIIFAGLCFMFKNNKGISYVHKIFTVCNLVVSGVISTLVLGFKSVGVVPAAVIREGLNITSVKFLYINIFLCAFLIAGFILILVQKVDYEN